MTIGLLFWILMILWFIFGVAPIWPAAPNTPAAWRPFGGSFLLWILLFLLGWHTFGFPIKG